MRGADVLRGGLALGLALVRERGERSSYCRLVLLFDEVTECLVLNCRFLIVGEGEEYLVVWCDARESLDPLAGDLAPRVRRQLERAELDALDAALDRSLGNAGDVEQGGASRKG